MDRAVGAGELGRCLGLECVVGAGELGQCLELGCVVGLIGWGDGLDWEGHRSLA